MYSPLYLQHAAQSRHVNICRWGGGEKEKGKKAWRKEIREGEKQLGDTYSSFNFLMWELRKLYSIMPKVPLHS